MKTYPIRFLLNELKNPHLNSRVVHVAGTKGKGSVTRVLTAALNQAGYLAGCYTSPHLNVFNERISIGGSDISDAILQRTLATLFQVVDNNATADWTRRLTFFDLATAAAFLAFSLEQVEIAVIEVGLGGRLDSTNVCQPTLALITNISFDHERQLGNTLSLIAREKAGIIKTNVPVLSAATAPDAIEVIAETAAANHSPFNLINRDFWATEIKLGDDGGTFNFETRDGQGQNLEQLKIAIPGRHQIDNACLSVAALQFLERNGFARVNEKVIRDTLANFQHIGRIEFVTRHPTIVMDVAHNVASTQALVDTLIVRSDWSKFRRKTLIVAISRDKDCSGILARLLPVFDRIIFTRFLNNPRASSPADLHEMGRHFRSKQKIQCEFLETESPEESWQRVTDDLQADDFVCIAGSLFLVAELRPLVLEYKASTEPPIAKGPCS